MFFCFVYFDCFCSKIWACAYGLENPLSKGLLTSVCLVVRLRVGDVTLVDSSQTVLMGPVGMAVCVGGCGVDDSLGFLSSSLVSGTGTIRYALGMCISPTTSEVEVFRGCNIFLPVIVDL